MGFEFEWDSDTVMRFHASDPWNWNDYHKVVRMAMFALHNHSHPVDVIIDLSATDKLPGGALAHVRSFGKRMNPNMTGRAIVIGLDVDTEERLLAGNDERMLRIEDRAIYFVDSNADAQTLLTTLQSD